MVVVVLAPVGDEDLGLGEAAELLDREQFVADAGVERGRRLWRVLGGSEGIVDLVEQL